VFGHSGSVGCAVADDAHFDFLAELDAQAAEALAACGRERSFRKGQTLFYRGDRADSVLVLRSGRVKVVAPVSTGRDVVLAFRGPGELVGELAALDGLQRSADVDVVDDVEALSVTVDAFKAFLAAHPAAALALIRVLSRRLRDADLKRIEFTEYSSVQRVARRLLEYGREENGQLVVSLTQEELAGAAYASLESAARALQTMRTRGWIETKRGVITILDRAAVERLVDPRLAKAPPVS
jgi:CRP/FNR family transcriptional regulator, cyclic AMP receptor protein